MRSVVVVLPASMCAMIPMLGNLLSGACLAIKHSRFIGAGGNPTLADNYLFSFHYPLYALYVYPLYALYVLVISPVTSDSARTPCWLQPCGARPRAS